MQRLTNDAPWANGVLCARWSPINYSVVDSHSKKLTASNCFVPLPACLPASLTSPLPLDTLLVRGGSSDRR